MRKLLPICFLFLLFTGCKTKKDCADIPCTLIGYFEMLSFSFVDKTTGQNLIENKSLDTTGVEVFHKFGNQKLPVRIIPSSDNSIGFSFNSGDGQNSISLIFKSITIDATYDYQTDKSCCPGPGKSSNFKLKDHNFEVVRLQNGREQIVVKL